MGSGLVSHGDQWESIDLSGLLLVDGNSTKLSQGHFTCSAACVVLVVGDGVCFCVCDFYPSPPADSEEEVGKSCVKEAHAAGRDSTEQKKSATTHESGGLSTSNVCRGNAFL